MRLLVIVFFLSSYLFANSSFEILSEITLNLDEDNRTDTIMLC